MTEEQLQILRAARPGGQDEHLPEVAAARRAAEATPEWLPHLEVERRNDLAMQDALRQVDPPAELEQALRAALRTERGITGQPLSPPNSEGRVAAFPASIPRRRWLGWGAAAAASLTLGSAWWWWQFRAFSMRRLSDHLAEITRRGVTLSLMSMNKDEVVAWLRDKQAPRADIWPSKLDALGRKGCHLYDIEGHPVSLECLLLPGMRELHLFATPSVGLLDPPKDGLPAEVRSFRERTLATWTRGSQTMLLFSEEPPKEMALLLA